MTTNVIVACLSLVSILSLIAYYISLKKISKLTEHCAKLFIDNMTLQKFIDDEVSKNLTDQEVHKENFIKFLSDSRDWAFTYIEDVQSGLSTFIEDIKPEIEYFREYGDIVSMQPNYYSMKKITEAYDKLVKLLPEEEKK